MMTWQGKELATIGQLFDVVVDIPTREEAQAFMAAYRATTEYADANIGYLSGYCGSEEMARIQDWFGVAHPIFGRATPTPAQAVAAGRAVASGAAPEDVRTLLTPDADR